MPKIDTYFAKVVEGLPKKVQDTLPRITEGDYRLLAIRQYLKNFSVIDERWAWTDAEETAFKSTQAYKNMMSEIEQIKTKFAENNKDHSLRTNTDVRTLEKQITFWNGNDTVKALGADLAAKAAAELGNAKYPEAPADKDVNEFKKWLRAVDLSATVTRSVPDGKKGKKTIQKTYTTPTHATPGLSSHGRLRAIDFVIYKGSTLVAGTNSATIKSEWKDSGFKDALQTAIQAVSTNWDGPLASPEEPWHWTYTAN